MHKASIFLGILKNYLGQGIGRRFFQQMFEWAGEAGLTRLELMTGVNNQRAIALYQSLGFEVECIKKQDLIIDGKPVDQYQMSLLLSEASVN